MGTKKLSAIEPARLDWQGDQPVSARYGDVYFSGDGAIDECEQIFVAGNRLTQRWQSHPQQFVIAETGFGTGLNFLCVCKRWFAQAGESAQLHYCAVEKHPLKRADLEQVLCRFLPLSELLELFLQAYPPLVPGRHRINLFSGRVVLTLAFMDVEQWLQSLDIRADAWFLDGFAPARNEAMWSNGVLQGVARNTRHEGSFATFSAAGRVRRGLEQAGFSVEKIPGFCGKREALRGSLAAATDSGQAQPGQSQPWFAYSGTAKNAKHAMVIGAGLAGAFTTDSLLRRGWEVTVIDRHAGPAREASGNRAGVIFSKLSAYDGLEYRFYQQAYVYAVMHLPQLLGGNTQIWSRCGMLQLAFNQKERQRQQALISNSLWPVDWLRYLDPEQAGQLAGIPLQHEALYFPQSGWVAPVEACRYLIGRNLGVELILNSEIAALYQDPKSGKWRAVDESGEVLAESEVVVIAAASDALSLSQTAFLGLNRIRGQVSDIQQTARSGDLRTVLCYDGYLTPSVGWQHSLGATFNQRNQSRQASERDNNRNLEGLKRCEPEVYQALCGETGNPEVTNARVGFRCHTTDYLPAVGPVPDPGFYHQAYAPLKKGQLKRPFPHAKYLQGLFVNVGHGSRGITSTPLSAEIIASYLNQEPQPVDESLRRALHPARFLIKSI